MAIVEVFAFWANFRLAITENEAHDVGGGMVIHTFGAYFGLAATFWMTTAETKAGHPEEKSLYSSDLFSLAGTILLWVLWPSFQSAVAGSEQRQFLAITNTFLSLCSSTLAFAAISRFLNGNKFDVVHMQNASLAGGVAMGVAGDMDMGLHGAMLAGFASGLISCVGYSKISPFLTKLNIHDTCGVNNLHGMPGIMSAIVGIIVTAKFNNGEDDNGSGGTREIGGFLDSEGNGVGADKQAFALLITIGVALAAGTLAGILMSLPFKAGGLFLSADDMFMDTTFFGAADHNHLHNQEDRKSYYNQKKENDI
jgi:ammonium transporter Rh